MTDVIRQPMFLVKSMIRSAAGMLVCWQDGEVKVGRNAMPFRKACEMLPSEMPRTHFDSGPGERVRG